MILFFSASRDLNNINVPAITASLEMLAVTNNHSSPVENKRVLRKRVFKPPTVDISNRR